MSIAKYLSALTLMILLAVPQLPAQDEPSQYATHLFKLQAEKLLEQGEPQSLFEDQISSDGMLAYADRKTPEAGDVEIFNTVNLANNSPIRIRAVLKKIGTWCYVYVEQGRKVDDQILNRIVAHFDRKIVPEVRSMFGTEWSPGIDGDKRITLLLLDIKDSYDPARGRRGFTSGYFNASDEFSRSRNPQSNQREMLYLDIFPGDPGSTKFLSVIAHEFQHMVHWHHDPKEYDWVDESLSQLAPFLAGYGHPPQVMPFVRSPDNNLCAWSNENTLANYGQVYLWAYYIATHISSTDARRREFVRKMVEQKSQGLSGLNAAIKKQGIKNNVANLFKSFCLANYLNDSRIARGVYGYDKFLAKLLIRPDLRVTGNPARGKATVKCWSARAVSVENSSFRGKTLNVSFSGQQIQAGRYSNDFDVAFVSSASNRQALPMVTWLNIVKFKGSQKVKVPSDHDLMMILVVNRGPETMKIEQTFAKGARPAVFAFAIAPVGSAANSSTISSGNSNSRPRPNSATVRRMLDEIISSPFNEDIAGEILAQKDDSQKNAEEVELELAFQKISETEDSLIEAIRASAAEGDFSTVETFVAAYSEADEDVKLKLMPLKNRILDVLRFESLQGNQAVAPLLAELEK